MHIGLRRMQRRPSVDSPIEIPLITGLGTSSTATTQILRRKRNHDRLVILTGVTAHRRTLSPRNLVSLIPTSFSPDVRSGF